MSGVLSQGVGRGDILLHRGFDEHPGVEWTRDEGDGFRPVDLTGWNGAFEMLGVGGDVWYSQHLDATCFDASGVAAVDIPWDAFTADSWRQRTSGEYRITGVGPDGSGRELLAWGYWHLA
jgi:hypothetical protein